MYDSKLMKSVSVIITVFNSRFKTRGVKSIEKQNYPKLEIIKVRAKNNNFSKARNSGARKAKGEILCFLDADCQAQEGWLKNNLEILKNPKVGAVFGKVQGESKKYFSHCFDFSNYSFFQGKTRRELPLSAIGFATKRRVFEKIGGFDESLKMGGEVDFSFRLHKIGLKTIYNPKVGIRHYHGYEDLNGLLKYQFRLGKDKGLFLEDFYAVNLWFVILKAIAKPWLYCFFIIPFALLATAVVVVYNLKDNPKVLLLIPAVFLAKLTTQLGIFTKTCGHPLKREAL